MKLRLRAALLAAIVLPALIAPSARALEYDPVASGTTTLSLAAPFTRLLAAHHISIKVRAGAKRRGRKILLPVSSGEFEPVRSLGTFASEGTVVFVSGNRKVPFRSISIKAKRSPLYARVGGTQFKVASAKKLTARREGFGIGFTAAGLRLSAKVATRLDKKLRLGKAIQPGQQLGTIVAKVSPRTVHLLPQNRVSMVLAPAFVAKLNSLFVSLNPVAPAELGPGPTLSFPIGPESILAPDAGIGLIKTGGAIELLQLGSAQIFWKEPWMEPGSAAISAESDIEPSPPKPGKQQRGLLLAFTGNQVSADSATRTIQVTGGTAGLTAATAESLNASFAKGEPTFAPGETIATISFTAQGH